MRTGRQTKVNKYGVRKHHMCVRECLCCLCVCEYSCNCVRVLNVVCVSALLTQQSERAVTSITQFLLKLTLTLRSYVNVMPSSISRSMISQKALNSCSKTLGEIITKTTTHLLLLSSC